MTGNQNVNLDIAPTFLQQFWQIFSAILRYFQCNYIRSLVIMLIVNYTYRLASEYDTYGRHRGINEKRSKKSNLIFPVGETAPQTY
jgi:hypothetical protein